MARVGYGKCSLWYGKGGVRYFMARIGRVGRRYGMGRVWQGSFIAMVG